MDIVQEKFFKKLLPVLESIGLADFIAWDAEFGGINPIPKQGSGERPHDIGKRTLQQQYDETKDVAETYAMLQLGICPVILDREKGKIACLIDYSCLHPFPNLSSILALIIC